MKPASIREDELRAAMDAAGVLQAIQAEMRKRGTEEVPAGWMTTAEWAKEWEMALSNARLNLKAGVESGLIEAKRFRVNVGNRVAPTWHFRSVVKVAKKKGKR